jgi:hypothetical protein
VAEPRLVTTIVHDLAGYLTSVNGLLEIIAMRPDHPAREEFSASVLKQSRNAVQAIKDLQLVRSIDAGDLPENIVAVPVEEVLAVAGERLPEEHRDSLPVPAPGLPPVSADRDLLAEVLGRCVLLALSTNPGAVRDVTTQHTDDGVRIDIDFGPANDTNNVEEARLSGRKGKRPIALCALLLPRWGGSLQTEVGETSRISLLLEPASSAVGPSGE